LSRQAPHLVGYEPSPRAFGEITEYKRTDRDADDAQHVDADRREDSPQLTILSIVEHDFEPGAAARAGAQQRDRFDLEPLARFRLDDAGRDALHDCIEVSAAHL